MNKQLSPIRGSIRVEITGQTPERFLEKCTQAGLSLWAIRRKSATVLVCSMHRPDPRWLKDVLKETDCRLRILDKQGLPVLLKRLWGRLGLLFGLAFFLVILLILSNMVWSVQVSGADPKLEAQIRSLLTKQHLYPGSLDFFVPDTKKMETTLSAELSKVTWIGVSREGTTYHVNVVQKKYPKKAAITGPRNIVATKQAIIQKLYIEKGQPIVESNQFVKPGQTLVLGRIGDENSFRFVAAKGTVIGETWYRTETQIPLRGKYTLYTGRSKQQFRLLWGHFALPVWGIGAPSFKSSDQEKVVKPIRFLFWKTPFSWQVTEYREKKTARRHLTLAEASDEALAAADRKLLNRLGADAKIISTVLDEKIIRHQILFIRSHQVVYENIGRYQVINSDKEREKLKKKAEHLKN
ncbi:MAG: sporulation protein YqfD [Sporolactobacillus sp.]